VRGFARRWARRNHGERRSQPAAAGPTRRGVLAPRQRPAARGGVHCGWRGPPGAFHAAAREAESGVIRLGGWDTRGRSARCAAGPPVTRWCGAGSDGGGCPARGCAAVRVSGQPRRRLADLRGAWGDGAEGSAIGPGDGHGIGGPPSGSPTSAGPWKCPSARPARVLLPADLPGHLREDARTSALRQHPRGTQGLPGHSLTPGPSQHADALGSCHLCVGATSRQGVPARINPACGGLYTCAQPPISSAPPPNPSPPGSGRPLSAPLPSAPLLPPPLTPALTLLPASPPPPRLSLPLTHVRAAASRFLSPDPHHAR